MWIQALQRRDLTKQNIKSARVFSKHFVTGAPAPTGEKDHPDYVPSINMGYKSKNDDFGRNNQYKRRGRLRDDNTNDNIKNSGTPRARNVYQRGTNISSMCRVCLTQSTNTMYDLTKVINDITDSREDIPIVQALQIVTSSTIILHPKFPQYICPVCMSVLKMAYRFIVQFKESQAKLEQKLNIDSYFDNETVVETDLETTETDLETTEKNLKSREVELIVDEKKYDLCDIVYVEENEEGDTKFDAFLSKLGSEITATFAGEKREEPKLANDNAITILMKDENGMIPVRELHIDETTNEIKVQVESDDHESDTDLQHTISDDSQHFVNETATRQVVILQELQTDDQTLESSHDHTYSHTKPNCDDSEDTELIDSLIIGDTGGMVPKRGRRISKLDQYSAKETACTECGAIFPTRRKMTWHKNHVHNPQQRIYECKRCGEQFPRQSAYTTHVQKHLGKRFSCELCGRTYFTKQHLKEHLSSHLGKKLYLCNVCGKSLRHKSGLDYHMLLHTDEKRYQCAYCARQFRMLCALRRHERTHTGEKPFQCRFCDKPFSSKSEVAAHENIHTGFRPYLCKFCHKGFTKTYNLKLHLLQHSGPHSCDICDRSFIQNPILLWHYKISHKDVIPDVDLSGWKLSDYFVRSTEQV